MASLRAQLRRIPPIAWRDESIASLREQEATLQAGLRKAKERNRRLQAELDQARRPPKYSPSEPSWHWRMREQARVGRHVAQLDTQAEHPRRRLLETLHNYELARSHGVATPRVLGVWHRLEDVPWDTLPERLVLRSSRGSGGRGVLLLQREDGALRVVDSDREMTPADIAEHFRQAETVSGPFFAEDLLGSTAQVAQGRARIYAFYGEVSHVALSRVAAGGDTGATGDRFVGPGGEDLGPLQGRQRHDPSIAVPGDLPVMIDVARVLSAAVPMPFVRVDLYQVPGGVVLGGLNPLPGSSQAFTQEHDRALGALYDEAEARLQVDLSHGRPLTMLFGPHSRDLSVPMAPTAKVVP